MCTAHNTETTSAGSQINFSKFAIQVFAKNIPTTPPKGSTQMYIARQPGRVPCHDNEITVKYSKDERKSTLFSSEHFQGKISYLKVFA